MIFVQTLALLGTLANTVAHADIEFKKPEPVVQKPVVVKESRKAQTRQTFTGIITAYSLNQADTGKAKGHKYYGITASGERARANHTIAADPSIPFGTKVKIEGLPHIYTVTDRGGAIKAVYKRDKKTGRSYVSARHIDLFIPNDKKVDEWGRQTRKVTIIEWGNGKRRKP